MDGLRVRPVEIKGSERWPDHAGRIFKFITSNFVLNPETTPSRTSSRCVLTVTTRYIKGESRTVS
jgi:hypothetical protein